MAETKLSLAYRALIAAHAPAQIRIVDTKAIAATAAALGFNPAIIRHGLVKGGYLLPVHFNGIYYLLDPDEFSTRFLKKRSFEIVAAACSHVFKKNWYFGLNSATYLSGRINQSPREFVIITDQHPPAAFKFEGNEFRIRQSSIKDYSLEIEEKGLIRFSAPARTITDTLYFNIREGKQDYAIHAAKELLASSPESKGQLNRDLIGLYPRPFNLAIGYAADQVCG